jgi:hypothetical protein
VTGIVRILNSVIILNLGTVSRDFLLLVFFMTQFSPQPQSTPFRPFRIFRKFASEGAPPVSTTPAANVSTIFASVVDTGGKFTTGVKARIKKSRDTVPLRKYKSKKRKQSGCVAFYRRVNTNSEYFCWLAGKATGNR